MLRVWISSHPSLDMGESIFNRDLQRAILVVFQGGEVRLFRFSQYLAHLVSCISSHMQMPQKINLLCKRNPFNRQLMLPFASLVGVTMNVAAEILYPLRQCGQTTQLSGINTGE